jgi:hypothetical protein
MTSNDFDIYQTESGYIAVTNDVRRQILNALAKKDRQLPELVKITRKAKPTLSSVHMKELLHQRLVEELAHPTDKRKKIYRLRARRIGSSNLPVDQLRTAVKQYAAASPLAARVLVCVALDAIGAAPPDAPLDALRAQARRLGSAGQSGLAAPNPREAVTNLASILEREGLARALRLDLEGARLELETGPGLPAVGPADRPALLVAGFVEGLLGERALGPVRAETTGERRFTLHLPPLA